MCLCVCVCGKLFVASKWKMFTKQLNQGKQKPSVSSAADTPA